MWELHSQNVSKRYGYQWIVEDFNAVFSTGSVYGIAGNNGSGKSTLIKILSGFLTPSKGEVKLLDGTKLISKFSFFNYISLVAPYTDLINEFTLREMFQFHSKFKKISNNLDFSEFEKMIQLKGQSDKTLQFFSSGMKQKIQLALALVSDTPILLLDEPTSFLDKHAKVWFTELLEIYKSNRIVIIASNDAFDLGLCHQIIELP